MKCPKCQFENPDDTLYCGKCSTPLKPLEEISPTKTLETPAKGLTTGTTFASRYDVVEELGKGGMGRVYKALDKEINEEVAIKLLKPEIASDDSTVERFRNELKFARKISHKNVCRMYHIAKEEGTPYIIMEYVPGEDLKSLVKRKGKLADGEAISTAKQVCEGLDEAHRLGVVHRDLKPQNIMIDKEGDAKIMDFGIARSVEAPGVTQSGVMIGTPDYMSPEQAEGEEADQRSDIYALGVILYEMVTGSVPFKGDTAFSVALKHKTKLPSDPRKLNPEISENLSRLILICMEKDRQRRYQTAERLLNDLRNIEDGLPLGTKIRPRRETFFAVLIRKKLFIPAMVVALAIIAIVVWQLLPQKEVPFAPKIENSIAVISFKNLTGDKAYDYLQEAIPNLLITNLENTGYFHVATWERMNDLLKQMGRKDVDVINRELGFELCLREGIESIILGSIIKTGNMFATDVKVLDVESKKLLKSSSSKGEGLNSIIKTQIDELSKEIALGIGMTREEIESAELNISEFTTTSMEAYNYFLRGRENWYYKYYNDAVRYLEKAVELDPNFAIAYLRLAQVYNQLRDTNRAIEYFDKAKALSEETTEKEKLMIDAEYALQVEFNREKYFQIYKKIAEKYPREKLPHWELGWYYLRENMYPEAIEELKIALELDPSWGDTYDDIAFAYSNMGNDEKALEYITRGISVVPGDPNLTNSMGYIYVKMGRLDEALVKFEDALDVKPDLNIENLIAYAYAMKEDYSEAFRWIGKFIADAPSEGRRAEGYEIKGFYHHWLGNSKQALDDLQMAANLFEEVGNVSFKVICEWVIAYVNYEREELDLSRDQFQSWFDTCSKIYPQNVLSGAKEILNFSIGLIELKQGSIDSAKSRLKEIEDLLPKINDPQSTYRHKFLLGEVLLSENSYDEAISILKDVTQKKMPRLWYTQPVMDYNLLNTNNLLAQAYKEKGDLDKAIVVYEQLTGSDPENRDGRLIYPKNYYKLAKLYEQKGWKGKAIKHYEKFLDLWKDADPGIAEVEDARRRLARLKNR